MGREAEGVRDAWRDRDRCRAGAADARFVQERLHPAGVQPQDLVQPAVHVGVDLPVVQAAARDDGFNVQHP